MAQCYLLALFDNFDDVEAAIIELLNTDLKGFNAADDLSIQSPIEHPEAEELLGEKPVYVQWFTLIGATLSGFLAFWLTAGSQANFYAQMKGGKPIMPIPAYSTVIRPPSPRTFGHPVHGDPATDSMRGV